ncbi:MAG TPA: DUF5709 domain-containing protein [Segeticoccus sp.]|uniref:DUF5709 domain-containing protein n=1 Tax=Segeticoccus sp. TaxID=2706531 RepID=UPI002D810273|nr:DUF5709 domain-containing protein [Segeticoccus sp.]HET8599744.1 DUF5709 domain-containing protein [Segeticoccus sp.]
MTDHESTGAESMGSYSLDDETQLPEEDTLDDRGLEDALDEGYSPPERPRGVDSFGTTVEEQERGETIDQRIRQEVPDPESAYGAPENESGLNEDDRVGGDDRDSIPADLDFLGDDEVGEARTGRLVAPDEGAHEDDESDLVAEDVGISGGAASSEEAAMHTVDEGVEADTDEDLDQDFRNGR